VKSGSRYLIVTLRLGRPAILPGFTLTSRPVPLNSARAVPVGERLRLGMTFADRPPAEQRQDAHVLGPGRRRAAPPPGPPARCSAYFPRACLQPGARVEQGDAMHGQELHPLLDRPRVVLPRLRRRRPAGRANSRSHRFTATDGRGAPGPSSNRRSSIDQHRACPRVSTAGARHPRTPSPGLEKKLKIMRADHRKHNTHRANPKPVARLPLSG